MLQRITHYKHGDHLEFKINFSARDLLTDKGRAVKDQMEALVQAVQKAGSYQAREEATRAVHAVMAGLKDRVPADTLSKLSESAPVREVARLGRAAAQRLQKDGDKAGSGDGKTVVTSEALAVSEAAAEVSAASKTPHEVAGDTPVETTGETPLL